MKIAVFWVVAPFYQTTRCYNPEDSNLNKHYNILIIWVRCSISSLNLKKVIWRSLKAKEEFLRWRLPFSEARNS
jgi:hypothetical protein